LHTSKPCKPRRFAYPFHEIVSERDAQSPRQRDHYFALVQNPGTLTEKETDWVERLETLYQGHAEGSQINGRILKALFPKWPKHEYWSEIKFGWERRQLDRRLARNFLQNGFLVGGLAVRDENDMAAAPG